MQALHRSNIPNVFNMNTAAIVEIYEECQLRKDNIIKKQRTFLFQIYFMNRSIYKQI